MRLNPILIFLAAAAILAILLVGASVFIRPSGPVLESAEFGLEALSPNADGVDDITRIVYRLRRPASVSIYFLGENGRRYNFRTDNPRDSGEHSLYFAGVVDGFSLRSDPPFEARILARVLPDGAYTWVVEARESGGETVQLTGPLAVADADTALPDLKNLTASPIVFSPNQDGIHDRVQINLWLDKEIPEDKLRVYLLDPQHNLQYAIPEGSTDVLPGRQGLHVYDYDGGIDNGVNPPPSGDYTVRAEAEDRVGQKVLAETPLSIQNSGMPRAEIYLGEVKWSSHSIPFGQPLTFELTVKNYGTAPIRTFGPWSGAEYEQAQNSNALGFYEQDGAWRVGIDCDSCIRDYPWRWGLGTPETLTPITQDGQVHYYLMPGQQAVITGSIVLSEVIESRNPQYFWAGLIHEAVGITLVNNRVDQWQVTIEKP